MGDKNQEIYLKEFVLRHWDITGPVLEVGSRKESGALSYREFFPDNEYVGMDMEAGEGVDIVQDLTKGVGDLPFNHFDLIICCSVFEHIDRPWLAAENLAKLGKPGGLMYLSVPWVWRFHAYPNDYFRYSPSAFPILFPEYEWETFHVSTRQVGYIEKINHRHTMGFDTALMSDDKLPYMMINSIGQKTEA